MKGGEFDFAFQILSSLAASAHYLAQFPKISGIAHTRKQETDRVYAMATELKKLGQEVIEEKDSLEITIALSNLKVAAEKKPVIHTYEDHRVSMSFAILGSFDLFNNAEPWLQIEDPNCCAKTFPNFYDELERIRPL